MEDCQEFYGHRPWFPVQVTGAACIMQLTHTGAETAPPPPPPAPLSLDPTDCRKLPTHHPEVGQLTHIAPGPEGINHKQGSPVDQLPNSFHCIKPQDPKEFANDATAAILQVGRLSLAWVNGLLGQLSWVSGRQHIHAWIL